MNPLLLLSLPRTGKNRYMGVSGHVLKGPNRRLRKLPGLFISSARGLAAKRH